MKIDRAGDDTDVTSLYFKDERQKNVYATNGLIKAARHTNVATSPVGDKILQLREVERLSIAIEMALLIGNRLQRA